MNYTTSKLFGSLSGILALGFAFPAVAQSDNGEGTIKIVRPLTVTNNQGMNFGTIIRPTSGGGSVTVTAEADTDRSVSGEGVAAVGGGEMAAKFTLEGEGGQEVSVSVPPTFTMAGSVSGSLIVTTSKSIGTAVNLSNALGVGGSKVFYVGGSIPIDASTAPGDYKGTFEVTASYN